MWQSWVLSGAGARGPFQVGVMSTLKQKPDVLVGCSAGALNAAGYSHLGIEGLKELWRDINKLSDVFTRRLDFWNALYSAVPLRKIILNVISKAPALTPYWVVYSDLRRMIPVYAPWGNREVASAIEASATIPGILAPVDGYKVDGGLFENVPIQKAIDLAPNNEASEIIVIMASPLYHKHCDIDTWVSKGLISVAERCIDAMCDEVVRGDIQSALFKTRKNIMVRLIQPPPDWSMDCLDFNPKAMAEAFELGTRWREFNKGVEIP